MKTLLSLLASLVLATFSQSGQAHFDFDLYNAQSTQGKTIRLDFKQFLTIGVKSGTLCQSEGELKVASAKLWMEGEESGARAMDLNDDEKSRCKKVDLDFAAHGRWKLSIELEGGDQALFDLQVAYQALKRGVAPGKEVYVVFPEPVTDSPQTVKICNAFHGEFLHVQLLTADMLIDLEFDAIRHACVLAHGLHIAAGSLDNMLSVAFDHDQLLMLDL